MWPGNYAPTPAHHFLKLLHDKGKLLRVYTQNIDSLEAAAGVPQSKIVAAHGNFDGAHVIDGGCAVPIDEVRDAVMRTAAAQAEQERRVAMLWAEHEATLKGLEADHMAVVKGLEADRKGLEAEHVATLAGVRAEQAAAERRHEQDCAELQASN